MIWEFIVNHKWWVICATVISIGGNFLLMGLPGGILMDIAERFVVPLIRHRPYNPLRVHGDDIWPLAIGITFLLPWVAFAFYLGFHKLFGSVDVRIVVLISCIFSCMAMIAMYLKAYPPVIIENEEYPAPPLPPLTSGEKLQEKIKSNHSQLYLGLELLSLSPEGQIEQNGNVKSLLQYGIRNYKEISEYRHKCPAEQFPLTAQQEEAVSRVDAQLAAIEPQMKKWNEDDLKTNKDWATLRAAAIDALKSLPKPE